MMSTKSNTTEADAHTPFVGDLEVIAEHLRRSTVQIRGHRSGVGSGVIWRSDGLIVTNAHVVRGAKARVELADGRVLDAKVLRRDSSRDLAALQVAATGLPAATVGDSHALRVGELVLAVGHPFGIPGALAVGIVHVVGAWPRGMFHSAGGLGPYTWVQADVRLAPGNSGGPLADARGYVIGINSMVALGLALAVPSQAVERFLRDPSQMPQLGVVLQPVRVPLEERRAFGLLVLEVRSGSSAEQAGILPGDVFMGAGGRPFNALDDLAVARDRTVPGAALALDLLRGARRLSCCVVMRSAARETEGV